MRVKGQWLIRPRPNPQAELRLFCVPYAGGAAGVYRRWHELFPREVEVCAVELPGRSTRASELPFVRLAPLVSALADAIEPERDRPFALFGHSLGGLIAFELARLFRRRGGRQPRHLFISATPAPGRPRSRPPVHTASDAEVKRHLHALNGTPRELLEDDEFMEMIIPIVRADFAVLETHEHRDEPPLEVPLSIFGGVHDREVNLTALNGWVRQSTAFPQLRMLQGDHFFLHGAAEEIVAAVVDDLRIGAAARARSAQARSAPGFAAPVGDRRHAGNDMQAPHLRPHGHLLEEAVRLHRSDPDHGAPVEPSAAVRPERGA
jgi:surfactin synthase thioesterase subunit